MGMALESALKKDVEKASRDLEALNRLYNVYFSGGEEDPPLEVRKALDQLVAKIKAQVATSTNSGDRFQANSLVAKYQLYSSKWDRMLRGIENGTIAKPQKRK